MKNRKINIVLAWIISIICFFISVTIMSIMHRIAKNSKFENKSNIDYEKRLQNISFEINRNKEQLGIISPAPNVII